MKTATEQNKEIVIRFNKEFLQGANMQTFNEIISSDVVNHAAPAGTPAGHDSMSFFLNNILRKGFPDLTVEIHDQIAEGDKVTTRKTIHATHKGDFMGIPPSNKQVAIQVIDIIRLKNGQYAEHWGMSNLADIVAQISSNTTI